MDQMVAGGPGVPPRFDWGGLGDIGTVLTVAVTLGLAVLVFRRLHVLRPFLTFIALLPILVGAGASLLLQIQVQDMVFAGGGNADPGPAVRVAAAANAHLLLGVVCAIALGIETVVLLLCGGAGAKV